MKRTGIWVMGGVSVLYVAAILFFRGSDAWSLFSTGNLNALGDFLAGFFTPLAFGWLVYGYLLQSRELSLQREELALTRDKLGQQVELLEEQGGEVAETRKQVSLQTGQLRQQTAQLGQQTAQLGQQIEQLENIDRKTQGPAVIGNRGRP